MAAKNRLVRRRKRADKVIEFIEYLTVPSGVGAGEEFKLRPFQKRFIRDVYEPHIGGRRCVRRAILSIGRKNGKSALIACLALNHLMGTERIMNGEIYSAATERDQAAIVFKMAAQIVRADPFFESKIKIVDSTKTMIHYETGSFYRAISAEAASKMGYNPTMVIYDELSMARNRDLYDALDTSMGAREEPLFVSISTQSADPNHILSLLIDDGLRGEDPTNVVHLYETPEDADPWDEKEWYKSNPALGDFRGLEDMRILAERAKRMPSFESTFRNLFLNQRTSYVSPFVARSTFESCSSTPAVMSGKAVWCGLDLSAKTDLTAMAVVWLENGVWQVAPYFWTPEGGLLDRSKRDRVPYDLWVQQGFLETTPGNTVDYEHVAARIGEILGDCHIEGFAFDRWRIDVFKKELDRIGLDLPLVPYGQGFKDQSPALDALEEAFLNQKIAHGDHPVLKMCAANAVVVRDPAGNRKLDKAKSTGRIDGMAALANAFGVAAANGVDGPSVYETRGVISF